MQIVFSDSFKKEFNKIKDKKTKERIVKIIKALSENPEKGKPLQNILKNKRSIRFLKYRLIYEIQEEKIILLIFNHRKDVYK